jgi:uncharacterized RDD family membrane protein YckC
MTAVWLPPGTVGDVSHYGRDYGLSDYGPTGWGGAARGVDPAALRPRILAFAVDAFVLFAPATLVAVLAYYAIYRPSCEPFPFLGGTRYDCSSAGTAGFVRWLLVLAAVVSVAFFYDIRPTGRTGQTWAKRRFGVMTVAEDTALPIGVRGAAVRFAIKWFVSLLWLGAGFWWAVGDPNRRSWHDRICETAVTAAPDFDRGATGSE